MFLLLSLRSVDLGGVGRGLSRVDPLVFAIVPLLRLCNFVLPTLRSLILLRPLSQLGFYRVLKSILLAFTVNNVVPYRAGELARVGYLSHFGKLDASTCVAVVAFERLLDSFALLLLLACTLPAAAVDLPISVGVYAIAGVSALAVIVAPWIARRPDLFVTICTRLSRIFGATVQGFVSRTAARFAAGLQGLSSIPSVLAVVVLTLGFWLVAAGIGWAWIWAFQLDASWYAPFVLIGVLSFGLAIPSVPGHVGTYHWLAIEALALVGVARQAAAPLAVLMHAMALVPFTLLSIPLLFRDYLELRVRRDGGAGASR